MTRERLHRWAPLLLVALLVVGIVLDRTGLLAPVEGLMLRLTTPFQKGATSLVHQVESLARTVQDLKGLRDRNEQLEAENTRLLLEIVRLREVKAENAVLRDLANVSQENPSFDLVGAYVIGRVIGQEPNNLQRFITLDAGREKGVARNMPVVTDRGLVGRIWDVGTGWSRVLLITDVTSSVSVLAQSTRASGLVQGRVDGELEMRSVPQGDTVSVGDTVFTSGLGGTFPRQLLIGQITRVERKDYELYQTAIVQPTVDFSHLETVQVITSFAPVGPGADGGEAP